MARYLSEEDVRRLLTVEMTLEAVESAHRDLALGLAVDVPRARSRLPQTVLHILQGALPAQGVIGYKAYTSNRSGNRFLVHVFDAASGALRGVLEADYLGMMRTGAASAVASRYLASANSAVAGVFGAGWQAEGHIRALCSTMPIQCVKVCARDTEKLRVFCDRLAAATGVEMRPCDAETTVRDSDIVGTVTTASTPLFQEAWLKPGAHLNGAGSNALIRQEISEAVIRRCCPVVVDSIPTALAEAGDLLPLLEKGRLNPRQLVELGDVVIGRHPGRSDDQALTLFESQGLAIQDLALAKRLLDVAEQAGLGQDWPLQMES